VKLRWRKAQGGKSLAKHLIIRAIIALTILGALLYLSLVRIVGAATADGYIEASKASTYEYITVSAQTLSDGTDESIKQYIDNYLLRANVVYAELQLGGFSYLANSPTRSFKQTLWKALNSAKVMMTSITLTSDFVSKQNPQTFVWALMRVKSTSQLGGPNFL